MHRPNPDWEVSGTHAAFVLATTAVFRGIDPGELQQACVALCEGGALPREHCIGRQSVGAGEVLFEQDTAADTLYVVESGRFEVLHHEPGGANYVHIASLKQADLFGEAVIAHERQRTATVRATADSMILVLHEDAIRELMRQFPSISTAILRLMFERQAELRSITASFGRSL